MINENLPFNPRVTIAPFGQREQTILVFDSNNSSDTERAVVSIILPTFDRFSIGSFSLGVKVNSVTVDSMDKEEYTQLVKGEFVLNYNLEKLDDVKKCDVISGFNIKFPNGAFERKVQKFNFLGLKKKLGHVYTENDYLHVMNQQLSNSLHNAMLTYLNQNGSYGCKDDFKSVGISSNNKYVRWPTYCAVASLVFVIAFVINSLSSSDGNDKRINPDMAMQSEIFKPKEVIIPVNKSTLQSYVSSDNNRPEHLDKYLAGVPSQQDLFNAVNTPAQNSKAEEQQVEITKQQLKKMGLDIGVTSDTGCFAPQ
ncbi:TPA: hypothetical protein U5D21_002675 [Yersinia enterocolitica]|nr:hypothetical protein [Yersinia enterocolitica]